MPDLTEAAPPPSCAAERSQASVQQQAFLLNLLSAGRLSRGELNRKLDTKAAKSIGFVDRRASESGVQELISMGLVGMTKSGRASVYEITEAGTSHLASIRHELPFGQSVSRGKIILPANDAIRRYRREYLLLQVLKSDAQGVTDSEANEQLDSYAKDGLELNRATASHLRKEMLAERLLSSAGGRLARYHLTQNGRLAVGNVVFPDDRKFQISGRQLNQLLEAAREVGKQFATGPAKPAGPPASEEIEKAIRATFHDLLRERYSASGLVPIHEVRSEITKQLGDSAGRHDTFDPVIQKLRQSGMLRLIPISNLADATPEQIHASVPGMGETLFYLEAARESATR